MGSGLVLRFPGIEPENAALGARLKRWREQRRVSIDELAKMARMDVGKLRLIEAGRARMAAADISAVTRALRLPLWALGADRPVR